MKILMSIDQLLNVEHGKPVCYMIFCKHTKLNVDVVFDLSRLKTYTNESAKPLFDIIPLTR